MAGASDTRDVGSRTLMISALVAAVFVIGGAQPSHAQTAAPIVFAKAGKASTASHRVEFAANTVDLRPSATLASL